MEENPLISIIIPTYNRAELIGETLDSIQTQTYKNWECIIVDDGSTDDTEAVVNRYLAKDNRLKFYKRPTEHLRGGSGARNYGLKQSQGQYIQWFDSDDLMEPTKIDKKVTQLLNSKKDFVISSFCVFNNNNQIVKEKAINFSEQEVDFDSFVSTHISWCTPDMMIKKEIADRLNFNEALNNCQEHNYICKLLLKTNNITILKEVLTKVRGYNESIGNRRRKDQVLYFKTQFDAYWKTFLEVKDLTNSTSFRRAHLQRCIRYSLATKAVPIPFRFLFHIVAFYKIKSLFYFLSLFSSRTIGKYHLFYSKLKTI